MKKMVITVLCLLGISSAWAQTSSNFEEKHATIPVSVFIPEQAENIPLGSRQYLSNKLQQIIVASGMSSNQEFNRFFLTAYINPTSKDILAGPPQQIAQNIEMTLYLADNYDQKVFTSASMSVKCVGINETKSLNNGLSQLTAQNKQLAQFINEGKKKILDYFNLKCPTIVKNANSLADQKRYEEALYTLVSVPEEADCYDEILQATQVVYQRYIDQKCVEDLAKAKSLWAAEQNAIGAAKAGEFLARIYPDAGCYGEAQALYQEIKGKVLDDWHFEMKIYQDQVDLEKQRIEAARQVGIAYGTHQQPTTNYMPWIRP